MEYVNNVLFLNTNYSKNKFIYATENKNGNFNIFMLNKNMETSCLIKDIESINNLGFYSNDNWYILTNRKLDLRDYKSKQISNLDLHFLKPHLKLLKVFEKDNPKIIILSVNIAKKFLILHELDIHNGNNKIIYTFNYSAIFTIEDLLKITSSYPITKIHNFIVHFLTTVLLKDEILLDQYSGARLTLKNIRGRSILNLKTENHNLNFNFNYSTINRAFFLSNKLLLINISTITKPFSLATFNIFTKEITYLNRSIKTTLESLAIQEKKIGRHLYITEDKIPVIKLKEKKQSKIILMLHGGPYYHFDFSYNPLAKNLLNNEFTVYMVNFYGSTGYGGNYKNKIRLNAGESDLQQVIKIIKHLNNLYPQKEVYVYGESYGAYLSTLLSFQKYIRIKKIISFGTFTDIRYQMLFSNSILLMRELFTLDNITTKNPIDLARNTKVIHDITFIHGKNDQHCPYQQIINFQNSLNTESLKKVKIITIDNFGHYSLNSKEDRLLTNLISKEATIVEE
ncbi:TPA: alpha/beta fold hydrolase [Bacillus cereus]|nr:alpha/beta fold hydrolase [Bacillus cereus]